MMRRTFVCVLGGCLFFMGLNPMVAVSSDNPYGKIVDRNIFGLKPPPPPPSPESLKPPPPKIVLTGVTTIGGTKRVLMRVPMPARPPEPAKEESLMMTEGQRDGDIEVLEIDEKSGTVRLRNYGTEMTLNLDKDGAKPQTTPVAGLPATVPTLNGTIPPPPRTIPTSMPPRTLRVPPNPQGTENPAGNGFRPASGMNMQPGIQPQAALSPEEQVLMIEAQR